MIDSHIHLSNKKYDQTFPYLSMEGGQFSVQYGTRDLLIQQFRDFGIDACIEPAVDIASNQELLALSDKYPGFLFPAVGLHPTRVYRSKRNGREETVLWKQRKLLEQYADHPRVVAIGETGLDYHVDRNYTRKDQHRFLQKRWFLFELKLAHRKNLPVILHVRDADADAIRILKRHKRLLHGGVIHCFIGSAELAKEYTDLGLKLGIGGSLLKGNSMQQALEEAVVQTPLECLLLETDAPFRIPDCPARAKRNLRNSSLILPNVAQRIAELKGLPAEEVLRVTAENAVELFCLRW